MTEKKELMQLEPYIFKIEKYNNGSLSFPQNFETVIGIFNIKIKCNKIECNHLIFYANPNINLGDFMIPNADGWKLWSYHVTFREMLWLSFDKLTITFDKKNHKPNEDFIKCYIYNTYMDKYKYKYKLKCFDYNFLNDERRKYITYKTRKNHPINATITNSNMDYLKDAFYSNNDSIINDDTYKIKKNMKFMVSDLSIIYNQIKSSEYLNLNTPFSLLVYDENKQKDIRLIIEWDSLIIPENYNWNIYPYPNKFIDFLKTISMKEEQEHCNETLRFFIKNFSNWFSIIAFLKKK